VAQLGKEYEFAQAIANLQAQVRALSTTPTLLNASTGQDGGLGLTTDVHGLHAYNSSGVQVNTIQTSDGTLITYDATGTPVARFGVLLSNPGHYGGEIWDPVNLVWVQLVTGASVSWASITGKPSTYPPSAHTHAGTDITSAVADASGSSYAYNNTVGGTSYYAVWVGNDTGNHLGKNTSSIRYKTNVTSHYTDPANVLALTPVTYQRISGGTTEYGLIAEQVAEHVPELVQWFDGHIDNVRYDLLAVALLSVVKSQDSRIASLEAAMKNLAPAYTAPRPSPVAPQNTGCNNPPAVIPAPLPYTIQPQ
jgi:hypothetical protein